MPQSGILLIWPHDNTDWRDDLPAVEAVYRELARAIAPREKLLVVCKDAAHRPRVSDSLQRGNIDPRAVRYAIHPCDDTWARDIGPFTVLEDGAARLLDFRFNGWGGKFPSQRDDALSAGLVNQGAFGDTPAERIDLVLEGGSIDTDGEGTLLTTRTCLLHPGRNPGLSREDLETRLRRHLGVERILWLAHGSLAGDDTDSHVDMLARFCSPGTLACSVCEDPADENAPALTAMREELARLRRADGQPYDIIELPVPAPIHDDDGRRLPASYANFLIINGAVLVPTYGDPNDAIALARLGLAFPGRDVIGIGCLPLIRQNGSLHCITLQLPAAVPI